MKDQIKSKITPTIEQIEEMANRGEDVTMYFTKGKMVEGAGGTKYDSGKPRMDLLPPIALTEVSKVLTFGANKYGDRNWEKGINYSRLIGAAMRHLNAYNGGQDLDPESGLSHVAHACCNLMMLIHMSEKRGDLDDRSKGINILKRMEDYKNGN